MRQVNPEKTDLRPAAKGKMSNLCTDFQNTATLYIIVAMANTVKKSLFVSVFEHVIRFILKFRIFVLLLIAIGTVFFSYKLLSLQIDANIYNFASNVETEAPVLTPALPPDGEAVSYTLPDAIANMELPTYGYTERQESEKLTADIPPEYQDDTFTSFPDGYVIIFSSNELYTPEVLNTISSVMNQLESLDFVGPCISPFDFVTVEKRGTRLALTPMSPVSDGEQWTEETAEVFRNRLLNDDMAKNYLYSEDVNTIMIYYRTRNYNSEQQDLMNAIVDPLRDYGRVALNGGSVITNRVTYYIYKDLALLLSLCFIVILFVYFLSYRSLRAVVIPSSLSIISIIWTLGTMAMFGYKLSIVTILTPCLVLTLGSSYSVHMLSEYFSEAKDPHKAVTGYARISKTILSAFLTTLTGFLSMLICRTEMFRDFGTTVSIGISYCAVLSILYLPSVLSLMPQPKARKVEKIKHGRIMGAFIHFVSTVVTKYWFVVLIVFILLFFGYIFTNDKIEFNSNYMDYFPQNDPLVIDSIYFAQTMGGTDPYYLTIVAPNNEPGFFLKSENLKKVYEYEKAVMGADPDIVQSLSFSQYVGFLNKVYSGVNEIPENNGLINFLYRTLQQMKSFIGTDILDTLISEDGSQVTLAMRNYDAFEQNLQTTASARRVEKTLDYYRYLLPEGTTSQISCLASRMLRASDMIIEDQNNASTLSLILIILIASITLFSVFRGLVATIPVLVGIMFNYIFMYVMGIPFDLVTVGFTSVTIGAGIDDALHFLLHYRYNRKLMPEKTVQEIISTTLDETGRPIILTTVSIVAGMSILLFGSYTPIQYFGLFMCVSLTVAMLATLFVLPVVMIVSVKIRDWMMHKIKK